MIYFSLREVSTKDFMAMNKLLVFSVIGLAALVSCTVGNQEKKSVPTPVAYTDWDRAIRVDVDMQNMYSTTPRKIEKPIDMYMAMALALKYNYTRRVVSYEESVAQAGKSPVNKLPEVFATAGYVNDTAAGDANSELKLAWNILDVSTVYYQSMDEKYRNNIAFEQSRKVIHNVLQETRLLYWKTLTAQKLLPTVNEMIEYMTLAVDEINARSKELAESGRSLSMDEMVQKRKYMEAVKRLSSLKREFETAEVRLATLMGLHPSSEYKLVGPEYGNFALPDIKSGLAEMEWIALTNRPELRIRDLVTSPDELKIYVKQYQTPSIEKYKTNPGYYNRVWAKKAKEVGIHIFEDLREPNTSDLEALRRQRMTNLVLSQVYVAWARYMSSYEDYQINQEIANVSENIAEDVTIADGSKAEKSKLEAAKAIEDEVQAYGAYVELQDSLGNLYATLGLDAVPYYMLNEKPSRIAVYLRGVFDKWKNGEFLPDNRPYLLDIPAKRPPVNLSSSTLVPDVTLETGQQINIKIPDSIMDKVDFSGKITTKAGMQDDSPLPKWLKYDENNRLFTGIAMPSDLGQYKIKVYVSDEAGNIGYITFRINIVDVYVPSMRVMGLTEGRKTTVLKRCKGVQCTDDYIQESIIGEEVVAEPKK